MAMVAFLVSFLLFASEVLVYGRHQEKCNSVVEAWSERALIELSKLSEDHHLQLKELLYFLHVPRTGGRTYHQCLLRHMYPVEQHCDGSYDKLRFNSSRHCRLLVTHHDYSILMKLPAESTSIVTNVRHPVDRIFSAYEFSVEVASRFLARNLRRKPSALKARRNSRSSTLNIWPWSLLVPWMREDLFRREEMRLSDEVVSPQPSTISHYNASLYVMPLHEYIHHPIAMDILHNGATFQVAGLTNNSYTKEARTIRKCVIDFPDLGHQVLDVAKRRIDKMIFVGLTDKHKDSAKLFAHVVGGQILPPGKPNNTLTNVLALSSSAEPATLSGSGAVEQLGHTNSSIDSQVDAQELPPPPAENLTVYGLIERYERCSGRLRSTQVQRRINSLRNISPVNFSTEARREVAGETLETIRQMNSLDLELYEYAQSRFSRYQASREHSVLSQPSDQSTLDKPLHTWTQNPMADGELRGEIDSNAIADGRLRGTYPSWFGSKNHQVLTGLGTMTLIAALIVLLKGGRMLRMKRKKISSVHEKL